MVVGALGFGHMVELHRAVVDGGLQFEHFAEAGGELRERALEFFFAKLAEDAFEFGLGLFQFFDGLQLLLGCSLAYRFFDLLGCFLHSLLGFAELFGGAVGGFLRLRRLLLLVVVFVVRWRARFAL